MTLPFVSPLLSGRRDCRRGELVRSALSSLRQQERDRGFRESVLLPREMVAKLKAISLAESKSLASSLRSLTVCDVSLLCWEIADCVPCPVLG